MTIEVAFRHHFGDSTIEVDFASSSRALALFGDSGAGKTTVLNVISGLLTPAQGRVALDEDILLDTDTGRYVPAVKRRVGYVFQDGRLFPHLSVRANLLYGCASQQRPPSVFDHVVALLDLDALLMRHPGTLSGGEKQRVAIGRALLSTPRILLLDEPLTGLHRDSRVNVLDYLRRLRSELPIATILVSHQRDEVVALADEVVLMHWGSVTGQMTAAEFSAA